ncbi:DUF4235 domain-containing protein [Propionibacteriaceae bacterium Y2011]|uniref:DUF4235 domain-containing protein n=1 Tax=Microlunatus sp. Y2014 TaxID=3418488 RepID=UPI003B4AB7E3
MEFSDKLVWKVYIGVIGAVTTIAAQKLITLAWRAATGEEPPSPTDPETPLATAATWALASGVGMGATQLLTARLAARHYAKSGRKAPGLGRVKLKL